nr:hypothetical protein [Methanothrix soehngenii]
MDLGINGLPRYADKGYSGAKTQGYDAAMKKLQEVISWESKTF